MENFIGYAVLGIIVIILLCLSFLHEEQGIRRFASQCTLLVLFATAALSLINIFLK